MSIFVFYKISTSILQFYKIWCHFLQFLSRLTSDYTTFKVAMSHFILYPCVALIILTPKAQILVRFALRPVMQTYKVGEKSEISEMYRMTSKWP